MNTSLVLTLDMRRTKKDGTYPVIIRISHYNRSTSFTTGVSVLEKDWDFDKKIIRKTYTGTSSVTRLNNFLNKQRIKAMDIVNRLKEEDKLRFMSITQLKEQLTQSDKVHSFFSFAEKLIAEMKKQERFGNATSYQTTINSLKEFTGNKDLYFEELNYDFLMKYHTDFLGKEKRTGKKQIQKLQNKKAKRIGEKVVKEEEISKKNSLNGLAVYMRTIRAIFNQAIKSGIADKNLYPFDKYKIKSEPTKKRALEMDDIRKILQMNISPDDKLFHTRNYFIASYLMCGMSFIDMAFLTIEKLEKSRVHYRRKKTSKLYDFVISKQLKQILDYYIKGKGKMDFVFPMIKPGGLEKQYKDVGEARKKYNINLKILAEQCGIDFNLTSYVSRHSFATQAVLKNVPLQAVSQMLGHSSITTTQIYLKSLPNNIMDEYLQRMEIK
ncbi:site-specific integrase [Chryseobacterium sp. PS-8]|uniref:Site-specific integrase n=1 Tax=Chryseobacterium indicum TaxID=2766954 RepID=A0ABS9C8Y4_9FLAO|nr:site-specific integrase [Chryseobacterium sp. PS-8]MCF2221031.1 site-specific integrase [Chryseobacterium sp. PS-8]